LTLVIRKDCNQLLSWSDANSQSGLDNVLKLVAKLLQNEDESGGLVIGDLIIHLLRRAGESVLPVLPELLQAMVGRMTSAKTATFLQVSTVFLPKYRTVAHGLIQSLVVPFCFLIHNQRDTVLSLLESTDVQGRSGLDILIHTWCENAETFQGYLAYPDKQSCTVPIIRGRAAKFAELDGQGRYNCESCYQGWCVPRYSSVLYA